MTVYGDMQLVISGQTDVAAFVMSTMVPGMAKYRETINILR